MSKTRQTIQRATTFVISITPTWSIHATTVKTKSGLSGESSGRPENKTLHQTREAAAVLEDDLNGVMRVEMTGGWMDKWMNGWLRQRSL